MSHGRDGELNYAGYLKLEQLLDLQCPRSIPRHADELHFVVTHQSMELWFKVIIDELLRVGDLLLSSDWFSALRRLRKLNAISAAQLESLRTFTHLDPQAFLSFRDFLGTASGIQSTQFRVIEVLSGLRDPRYLEGLQRHLGALPGPVVQALTVPSMAESAETALQALGVERWSEIYTDPAKYDVVFLLAEELVNYDAIWMQWRYEHLVTVERIIGRLTRGTAGALPSYLERRVAVRFFPEIWDARHDLLPFKAPN
jgi:tryptophan 2,3-dioxygenase